MARAAGRVITTTFASNISRIKQIIEIAAVWGRRTAIVGRSMDNYTKTARELGYLTVPEGSLINPRDIDKLPDHEICIITTGSQGGPTSALSRMALGDHRHVTKKFQVFPANRRNDREVGTNHPNERCQLARMIGSHLQDGRLMTVFEPQ
jgi:ribonuclease J